MTGGTGKNTMRRKKIKKSLIHRLFVLSLSFVLVGGVCLRPFLYEVKAGEIAGTVGLLADTVTLWDIFNTVSAGAGVIVANDLLQSASQENLDDILGKPIGYINSQGLIEYNDGTSPPEWDWSGLEQALQNSTSARAKIIEGVFGQSGGSGQGGDNNDPWYRKFINWCKAAVEQGKIKTSQVLGNITPLTLEAISLMMGSFLGSRVEKGVPSTTTQSQLSTLGQYSFFCDIELMYYANKQYERIKAPYNEHVKFFCSVQDGQAGRPLKIVAGNNSDVDITYPFIKFNYQGDTTPWTIPIQAHKTAVIISYETKWKSTNKSIVVGNYAYSTDPSTDALIWARDTSESITIKSPDVMTVLGPAQGGNWVPTPYYDGEGVGEFEIIPQEIVTNYTTYINNNNLSDEDVGEEFEEVVNPYVQQEPEPGPEPTSPPEPVATPTTAPAYDPDAELGTPQNPITIAEPDPVPGIGAGEGQLPGIATLFPFCIPWDLKYIIDMFTTDQSALAPHFEWDFTSTIFGNFGTIEIDLSDFDDAAAIARKLEFLLFAVSLLIGTKNLIWS